MGLEVCSTLGMLTEEQAQKLKNADWTLTITTSIHQKSTTTKLFRPGSTETGLKPLRIPERRESQFVLVESLEWVKVLKIDWIDSNTFSLNPHPNLCD